MSLSRIMKQKANRYSPYQLSSFNTEKCHSSSTSRTLLFMRRGSVERYRDTNKFVNLSLAVRLMERNFMGSNCDCEWDCLPPSSSNPFSPKFRPNSTSFTTCIFQEKQSYNLLALTMLRLVHLLLNVLMYYLLFSFVLLLQH